MNDHFDGTRPLEAAFALEEKEKKGVCPVHSRCGPGLVKVSMDKKVELVSSQANGHPIKYANDVDVDPATGYVYFTDSTDIAPPTVKSGTLTLFDTLGASIQDLLRSRRTGDCCVMTQWSGRRLKLLMICGLPMVSPFHLMESRY